MVKPEKIKENNTNSWAKNEEVSWKHNEMIYSTSQEFGHTFPFTWMRKWCLDFWLVLFVCVFSHICGLLGYILRRMIKLEHLWKNRVMNKTCFHQKQIQWIFIINNISHLAYGGCLTWEGCLSLSETKVNTFNYVWCYVKWFFNYALYSIVK